VASCLNALGKGEQAIAFWQAALPGHDFGRIDSAHTGFGRSHFGARSLNPRQALAVAHAREGKAEPAWQYAEEDLARGLVDDLHRASDPLDAGSRAQVARLDEPGWAARPGQPLRRPETPARRTAGPEEGPARSGDEACRRPFRRAGLVAPAHPEADSHRCRP